MIMPAKKTTSQQGRKNRKTRAVEKGEPGRKVRDPGIEANSAVLERGDLFFFYRPDVDETSPNGLVDVRRFHIVLRPEGKETLRLITIGRKKLPEAAEEGRSHWAFVDRVFGDPDELREALSGS